MKRMILLLLLVLLACPVQAEESGWYLDMAAELAGKVGELVGDEGHLEMMSGQSFECLEALREADFGKVLGAYHCILPDETGMRVLLNAMSGWELSDAAMEIQISSLPTLPISMYNGNLGAEEVAASAIATYSRTYVEPEGFEPCVYVLELDGAAVGVAFRRTGDETITVSAQPLFIDEGKTMEDMLETFKSGYILMEIEKIR